MPGSTRWIPWSIVAGTTVYARDLPVMIGSARVGLRNRLAWARERPWWRPTITRAWVGIVVLDGNEVIAASTAEADRVEAVSGGDRAGRTIAIILYGLTASVSPLVDPGEVRAMLRRGRAWSGLGQVDAGGAVDQAGIADTFWTTIGTAWDRRLDDDIVAALATGRGWQSMRYQIGPVR